MKIGIIGAGNIGRVLALRWVERGHEVLIGNSRGPDTLAEVAGETGAKPSELTDVVRGAAVIVVTIPEKESAESARRLVQGRAGNYRLHRYGQLLSA